MNYFNKVAAATSTGYDRIQDKKAINTQVNKTVNFFLGLSMALLSVYLIIELNSTVMEKKMPVYKVQTVEIEPNIGKVTIIEETPKTFKSEPVKKQVPIVEKPIKVDLSKPPVIDDKKADDFDKLLAQIEPNNTDVNDNVDLATSDTGISKPVAPITSNVNIVSEVPLFPGCDSSMKREDRIKCLNEKMAKFVRRKFDSGLANAVNGRDKVKISVLFTIGVNGLPKDIMIQAPNEALKKEARRVINRLPKMTPGKMNGEAVNVTYSLPIVYKVD